MKKRLILLLLICVTLVGCTDTMMKSPPVLDEMVKDVNPEMMDMEFDQMGDLLDVTDGEVQGINTNGEASGVAKARFRDGEYNLLATFEGLPDPQGTDFYEGWIVRTGIKFNVISTGALEKVDGKYVNMYTTGQDLSDHTLYVLTIEPDDGNPAPAGHVVEGRLS